MPTPAVNTALDGLQTAIAGAAYCADERRELLALVETLRQAIEASKPPAGLHTWDTLAFQSLPLAHTVENGKYVAVRYHDHDDGSRSIYRMDGTLISRRMPSRNVLSREDFSSVEERSTSPGS